MISNLNHDKLRFAFRFEDKLQSKTKRKSGTSNAAEVCAVFEATSY